MNDNYFFFLCYRRLSNGPRDKNSYETINDNRLLNSISIVWKSKMSMQSHSKILAQLKDYLNKSGYNKNLQIIFIKDWFDFLQKLTYSQINALKRFSSTELSKITHNDKALNTDQSGNNKTSTEKITLESGKHEMSSADFIKHEKVCYVYGIVYEEYVTRKNVIFD